MHADVHKQAFTYIQIEMHANPATNILTCIHTDIITCTAHIPMLVNVDIYIWIPTSIENTCTHTSVNVPMRVSTEVYTLKYMHIYIYIYVHVSVCIYIYMHTYVYHTW